jgi:HupE/UreJ protein
LLLLSRAVVVLGLLLAATLAAAHPAPFSYLDVYLDAEGARGAVVIHDFDAAHELKIGKPELLLESAFASKHRDALVALLESRLRLTTDDAMLTFDWGAIEVLEQRQSLRLPFRLDRPIGGTLDIEAWLFPYDTNHQTFINLYENGELRQQAILDARRQAMRFYSGSVQGRWAVISTFVKAGIHHILIGPDHVLFLLGLMLLGGSWWRLATIVTAFTLGHSITLSLAALGILQISPSIVEPAIALSIIVVGVDNLLVTRQRRSAARGTAGTARDLRPALAAVFGLIHGFGFAAVLIEFGLPREALGWSLAAFNVGVEVGQLFIVLAMLALAALATRLPTYRAAHAERFLTLASMAVIAAGVYWLVQRIGFTTSV